MKITVAGPKLAVATCSRRLAALLGPGTARVDHVEGASRPDIAESVLKHEAEPSLDIDCRITWHGPAVGSDVPGSESMIQATCGLSHLHGLEAGTPRRVGIEVASVAAGVLASHGVLASLVANARGGEVSAVRTSVTQAALLSISQYIARTTASGSSAEWVPVARGPEPGPPFQSADGHGVEIETLSPEAWTRFWMALGVDQSLLGRAWTMFSARYSTATCSMPPGFHAATRRRPLVELIELARSCGVSLCRIRNYEEVLKEPGIGRTELPVLSFPSRGTFAPVAQSDSGSVSSGPASDLPLAGIRVVEATSRIQGPLAGQLLRMLGADVLRIEPPGGDANRMTPPSAGEAGAFFLCVNRGKRSVELDLADADGRRRLTDLTGDADAFLHNWRPGKAEEWRLASGDLAPLNPALVYATATGWGEMAPKCPPIGMEFLVQAYAGLGNAIQPEGKPPWPTRLLLTDFMGAMVACEAILAGLYQRQRTGHGGRVESSLLTGAMALQGHVLEALASGRETGRRQGRPVWTRLDHPLQTAAGHILVTAPDDEAVNRLGQACGVRYSGAGRKQVEDAIAEAVGSRPAKTWERKLVDAGIPCGAVSTDLTQLPSDPALKGCLEPVGTAWMPGIPWTF